MFDSIVNKLELKVLSNAFEQLKEHQILTNNLNKLFKKDRNKKLYHQTRTSTQKKTIQPSHHQLTTTLRMPRKSPFSLHPSHEKITSYPFKVRSEMERYEK